MHINSNVYISQNRTDKSIRTNLLDPITTSSRFITYTYFETHSSYNDLLNVLRICRSRESSREKNIKLRRIYTTKLNFNEPAIQRSLFKIEPLHPVESSVDSFDETDLSFLEPTVEKLIKFFSEFRFSPSFRFVNSLIIANDKLAYTKNYFDIQDHKYAKDISEKIKSAEYEAICTLLSSVEVEKVNTHLEVYFGDPGTGKTTDAAKLAKTCTVCSSDMLPVDLMQNFVFDDGKATFQKSDIWIAMENGYTILLDEINMLPFETLRFLQGITDNKSNVSYKGIPLTIHKDFKIIGTMNLTVNGSIIPLPEPLVDRCYEIKDYTLNARKIIQMMNDANQPKNNN